MASLWANVREAVLSSDARNRTSSVNGAGGVVSPPRRALTHKGHQFVETPAEEPSCGDVCRKTVSLCPKISLSSLPIVQWLPRYSLAFLRSDILAGITVGVLLIPQSMASSLLAGLPPIHGLYSSTVPLIVYGLLASSTKVTIGPSAPTSILINGIITAAVADTSDTAQLVTLATTLAFTSGLIQIVLGMLQFGFIAQLLSWPVMSGYLAGAAVTIVASQLRDFFGARYPPGTVDRLFYQRVYNFFRYIDTVSWETTLISLACLTVLVGYKYLPSCGLWPQCLQRRCGKSPPRWMPLHLLVVIVCILLAHGLGLSAEAGSSIIGSNTTNSSSSSSIIPRQQAIAVVGTIPRGLPTPSTPFDVSSSAIIETLPQSFVLAIIAYMGTISLGVSFARRDNEDVSANMELFASGFACLAGSFFSSFTVSGSFTRTTINTEVGARTPVAVMVTGVLLLLTLQFLAGAFELLPKAALAAMVVASTQSLMKPVETATFWRMQRLEGLQATSTFVLTLLLGIDWGIIAAVGFAIALMLLRSFKPRIAELGNLPGTSAFADRSRYPEATPVRGVIVYRIDGELHFGNVKALATLLRKTLLRAAKVGAVPKLPHKARRGSTQQSVTEPAVAAGGGDAGGLGEGTLATPPQAAAAASSVTVASQPATPDTKGSAIVHVAAAAHDDADVDAKHSSGSGRGAGRRSSWRATGEDADVHDVLRGIVIDAVCIHAIDLTSCRELRTLGCEFAEFGVGLILAAMPAQTRDVVERFGVMLTDEEVEQRDAAAQEGTLEPIHRFLTVAAAVNSLVPRSEWPKPRSRRPWQLRSRRKPAQQEQEDEDRKTVSPSMPALTVATPARAKGSEGHSD